MRIHEGFAGSHAIVTGGKPMIINSGNLGEGDNWSAPPPPGWNENTALLQQQVYDNWSQNVAPPGDSNVSDNTIIYTIDNDEAWSNACGATQRWMMCQPDIKKLWVDDVYTREGYDAPLTVGMDDWDYRRVYDGVYMPDTGIVNTIIESVDIPEGDDLVTSKKATVIRGHQYVFHEFVDDGVDE